MLRLRRVNLVGQGRAWKALGPVPWERVTGRDRRSPLCHIKLLSLEYRRKETFHDSN